MEQRTLALFMDGDHWEWHVRRMRTLYKKKHDTFLCAVEHYFGNRAVVAGQGAGLHIVLQMPGSSLNADEVNDRARQKGVRLFLLSDF